MEMDITYINFIRQVINYKKHQNLIFKALTSLHTQGLAERRSANPWVLLSIFRLGRESMVIINYTQTREVAPRRGATSRVWVIYSAQVLITSKNKIDLQCKSILFFCIDQILILSSRFIF
jgi:hypothetical protein